jgi:hypothetical protein
MKYISMIALAFAALIGPSQSITTAPAVVHAKAQAVTTVPAVASEVVSEMTTITTSPQVNTVKPVSKVVSTLTPSTTTTTEFDDTPVHFIELNGYCATTARGPAEENNLTIVDDETCANASGKAVIMATNDGTAQTGVGETQGN